MEGDQKVEMSPSGGGAPPSTHRWNPTKEQITMLENLYKQGIRTPSAEQIQEITIKLKVYGHIEGKNVFYWFQNHKARQRQKLKQDNIACFNRYFQHPPNSPFHPPPYPINVVRNPYYVPQCELGFYPQCPKLLLPGGRKWSVRLDNVEQPNPCNGESGQLEFHPTMPSVDNNQETLPLFPLHPTGVLKERTAEASNFSMGTNSSDNSTTTTPSSSEGAGDHRFFDFFG